MKPVRSSARALLGAIFVVSGVRNLLRPGPPAATAQPAIDQITPLLKRVDPRLPTDPRTLVRIKAGVDLVGGLLLTTGRLTRPAAVALAAGLVPTTYAGHPFWAHYDPAVREQQQVHFLKNLGLLGGLLLAAADTEGRPGLRYRAGHAVDRSRRTARRAVRQARREAKIVAMTASATRRLPG